MNPNITDEPFFLLEEMAVRLSQRSSSKEKVYFSGLLAIAILYLFSSVIWEEVVVSI